MSMDNDIILQHVSGVASIVIIMLIDIGIYEWPAVRLAEACTHVLLSVQVFARIVVVTPVVLSFRVAVASHMSSDRGKPLCTRRSIRRNRMAR
jgi:uncharacterized membrane protein